jgi:hypothetical protein
MTEARRRGQCEECGDDEVAMATKHVCFKCYMRHRRDAEQPDLHNPSLRKEHTKLVKLYSTLMSVLAGLKVNDATKDAVMVALRPYFRLIEHLVNLDGTAGTIQDEYDTSDHEQREALGRIAASTPGPTPLGYHWPPQSEADIFKFIKSPVKAEPISDELAIELREFIRSLELPPADVDEDEYRLYFGHPSPEDWAKQVLVIAASHGNIRAMRALQDVAELEAKQRRPRISKDKESAATDG